MATIRVMLVDDHPVMRDGVRNLLERDPELVVVGEAGNGVEALRQVATLMPDVLVLDMALPDMDGVDVAHRLRAASTSVRILGLSAHDDAEYIVGLLAAGGAGYLLKSEARQAIVDAVRGVARGEEGWYSRPVTARLLKHEGMGSRAGTASPTNLSAREREVLRLLSQGWANARIAAALHIAVGTVHNHVVNIHGKLGLHKRSEVVAWAWQQGLDGGSDAAGVAGGLQAPTRRPE